MSLPPGFLDEVRSRVSLASVVGRKVTWDMRKSNQGKGDMWAPCPFHQEKTASFHVLDREGYYYCFGCQAKGDVITFLKEAENMSFMEAVEELAKLAGMTMPARDPEAQKKIDRRTALSEIMDKAVRHYALSLNGQGGRKALSYLEGRGLSAQTRDRFELGFAPTVRDGILQHLTGRGVPEQDLIDCGLCARPEDGHLPYDRFRNRIMFPIRDARGRCIGFGGRAMEADAKAKYLNSPETILFDKGRSLYNVSMARSALGKGTPLIVAEGYMDVIALAQAGFETAVAPLGTAITPDQLQMMWRLDPEPVIALDGDKAGLRAAYRLIDLALPLIGAGRALRFALMPEGQDPDDVIRERGPEGFSEVLTQAIPMVDLIWHQATEGRQFDSPERKAMLDKELRDKVQNIPDQMLRSLYTSALREKRWAHFKSASSSFAGSSTVRGKPYAGRVSHETKSSALVSDDHKGADYIKEAVIVGALINCPKALIDLVDRLEVVQLRDKHLSDMLSVLCRSLPRTRQEAEALIDTEIGEGAVKRVFAERHVAISPCMKEPENVEIATLIVREELAKLEAQKGLAEELNDVVSSPTAEVDDTDMWRISRAAEARNRSMRADLDDKTAYDLGDNGAKISREERSALDKIIGSISFDKRKK